MCVESPGEDSEALLGRAWQLGDHAVLYSVPNTNQRKPIKFRSIDLDHLKRQLSQHDVPELTDEMDRDIDALTNTLYKCAKDSRCNHLPSAVDSSLDRWERLMNDPNDKKVWEAIDWRGEYRENSSCKEGPSDEEFQSFFETLYNPQGTEILQPEDFRTNVSIPVLDALIQIEEVQMHINGMKPDKSCGPDGICPGVLKYLPAQWIVTITALFNVIFSSGCYPPVWRIARMFAIYKKGNKMLPRNYRGIGVINCLAKLFDLVLCARLSSWFVPYREQSGSQRGKEKPGIKEILRG